MAACYSKRRRDDTQVLHPEVVRLLRTWLKSKRRHPDSLLFPVSGRVPGGTDRKTHKMVRLDLAAARKKWIADAKEPAERARLEASDFLRHRDQAGRFVDFHALRHFFITSLERAGISTKMAQTLARHSDIRPTLGVYTHVEMGHQVAAIGVLAGPNYPNPGASIASTTHLK